mgnify:CR=1 FL=1
MAEYAATGTFKVPTGNRVTASSLDAISMAQWLSRRFAIPALDIVVMVTSGLYSSPRQGNAARASVD